MTGLLAEYGLFLLKLLTFVIAVIAIITVIFMLTRGGGRRSGSSGGHIEITNMNESLEDMSDTLQKMNLDPAQLKLTLKQEKADKKAKAKEDKKAAKEATRRRGDGETRVDKPSRKSVFVVDFDGDIRGNAVNSLRKEISAILTTAKAEDEVVVRLESGGGMVASYGLGASQLERIRKKGIPLTVCIDKVAASGGYMMACVASKIIAAPFAIVGSIGVVAQIPNFHRLLKEYNIDFELMTAGKFKRTLTLFGENTDEAREKFLEDIELIHKQFKSHVQQHRSKLDIEKIATGETWSGQDATELNMVDELLTSDEYLMRACESADVFEIKYKEKKNLLEKVGMAAQTTLDNTVMTWLDRLLKARFLTG